MDNKGKLKIGKDIKILREVPLSNFLWIDLKNVDPKTEDELENFLKIYIQEEDELEEIELSSRFIENRRFSCCKFQFSSRLDGKGTGLFHSEKWNIGFCA